MKTIELVRAAHALVTTIRVGSICAAVSNSMPEVGFESSKATSGYILLAIESHQLERLLGAML